MRRIKVRYKESCPLRPFDCSRNPTNLRELHQGMGRHSEGVGLAAVDAQDEAKLQKNPRDKSREKRIHDRRNIYPQMGISSVISRMDGKSVTMHNGWDRRWVYHGAYLNGHMYHGRQGYCQDPQESFYRHRLETFDRPLGLGWRSLSPRTVRHHLRLFNRRADLRVFSQAKISRLGNVASGNFVWANSSITKIK